jgi:hypothetical protein
MKQNITVQAIYDAKADVWVATSEDVIGLVAEASTLQELSDIVADLIPELLELNHQTHDAKPVPFMLHSLHEPRVH